MTAAYPARRVSARGKSRRDSSGFDQEGKMKLGIYRPGDLEEIYQLFYDTVHFVNRADYSPEQLDAWAPRQMDRSRWEQSLAEHETWVAWEEGRIVGFGDLAQNGYLDRLYVRKDSVRKGAAPALLHRLEAAAVRQGCRRMDTEASITARPFFEHRGYRVVKRQEKLLRGQVFVNFVMEKIL